MTEQGMARVLVTKELLIQLLCLPNDTEVLSVRIADDPRNIELVVKHQDLPPVKDGEPIPLADPLIQQSYTTFLGWRTEPRSHKNP